MFVVCANLVSLDEMCTPISSLTVSTVLKTGCTVHLKTGQNRFNKNI